MTMKQMREHLHARPFRPFVVRTVRGAMHTVGHPDYLFMPPVGETVIVVELDGTIHNIDVEHIEALEFNRKGNKPSAQS